MPNNTTAGPNWEWVRPWIEAALADGGERYAFADVVEQVEQGEAHLWAFDRSAVVTRFMDEPAGRSLFFWLAGGDLGEILSHEDGITQWAKANGCNRKILVGRKGWEKALGWKVAGVMLAEVIE